jgi:hypothetical protein
MRGIVVLQVSDTALHSRSTLGLQQLKLVSVFYHQLHTRGVTADDGGLISLNFLLYLTNRVERSLDCAYVTDGSFSAVLVTFRSVLTSSIGTLSDFIEKGVALFVCKH